MRSAPVFQPALESFRAIPLAQACDDGLIFTAHYPVDEYAASLADGAALLELWTDLPIAQSSSISTSRPVAWNAYPLEPIAAAVNQAKGYSFVARVKCAPAANERVFGFTYRIVHPDGQIDWLGSPSTDGRIHLPASDVFPATIRRLMLPHSGTRIQSDAFQQHELPVEVATLGPCRGTAATCLAFDLDARDVQSGLVIERTKSTWCTSRRFQSLHEVSSDFAASLLVLELGRSAAGEVLVVMPVFDDSVLPPRLVRSVCNGDRVTFQVELTSQQVQVRLALALGPATQLEDVIKACRSHAARLLRTCVHEPLGLPWSAAKALDDDVPLPASIDLVALNTKPYSEPDFVDVTFDSDSTAVEGLTPSRDLEESLLFSAAEDGNSVCESDYATTINEDRTIHADSPPSPKRPEGGLGFCTWEAMQNEERRPFLSEVVAALEATEKRTGRGSITSLLIDDGWQDITRGADHRGRLQGFDMDAALLDLDDDSHQQDGSQPVLASYVSCIRRRFPSIRSVGCWMTLSGYWDGIDADGSVAASLSAPLAQMHIHDPFRNATREWHVPATELDMHLFWDKAFHSLRSSGVDFVKIDAQAEWEWSQLDRPIDPLTVSSSEAGSSVGKLGKAMFEAMEGAAARYFGSGGVIHSMALTPALTNTARTLHSQGMTVRCTDDFFPNIKDAHRHHLAHNAYNALLLPEHICDADMLAHCAGSQSDLELDFTGYHASFRAFTDARLWLSDRADAPAHASMRALAAPLKLSVQSERVRVQARGHLLGTNAFKDLISDSVGPALKLHVQHEGTNGATLGLWNLRGAQACTFDVLDASQLLNPVADAQRHDVVVRGFRSGKIWILDGQDSVENSSLLSATLEAESWEVLTLAPVLTVPGSGVAVAVLGSIEHFMTPEGISSVAISAAPMDDGVRKHRSVSGSRRPSHARRRSTRSISTSSNIQPAGAAVESSTAAILAPTPVQRLVQEAPSGSRAVLVSLALINGFFSLLQGAVTGAARTPRPVMDQVKAKSKKGARVDVVDTMIGLIDKLQTLVVFGVLILASWTSILPSSHRGNVAKSWLPWQGGSDENESVDGKTLKRVRLSPYDATTTLKRCLASRTLVPFRECPIAITEPAPATVAKAPAKAPASPTTTSRPDSEVVLSCLVDSASTIGFLVLCAGSEAIKACVIDRTTYDCESTPWISLKPAKLEEGSMTRHDQESAWTVEIDMQAWLEHQDVTYLQTLAAPVQVAIRVAAAA